MERKTGNADGMKEWQEREKNERRELGAGGAAGLTWRMTLFRLEQENYFLVLRIDEDGEMAAVADEGRDE